MKDKARQMYIDSNGSMPLKDIAEELGVSDGSVRGWKSRYKWDDELHGDDVTLQRNATTSKRSATKKRDAPKKRKEQKNRSGNPNPQNQFTKRNRAAVTHGLFRKYLPDDEETREIYDAALEMNPVDMLWEKITIAFTNLIRSQKLMFVRDQEDIVKVLKKEKAIEQDGFEMEEREWQYQFPWDRQASLLQSQARAMSELRSMIKQFLDLAHDDDERRLKLEQMKLGIEKTRVELTHLSGETEGDAHEQGNSYEEALNAQIDDVFADEVNDDAET